MDIIGASDRSRTIKRKAWGRWARIDPVMCWEDECDAFPKLTREDILAGDWEAKEEPRLITRDELTAALKMAHKEWGTLTVDASAYITKRLGFK